MPLTLDLARSLAIETIEAKVLASIIGGVPPDVAETVGMTSIDVDGTSVAVFKTLDHPLFNTVIGLGLSRPASERMIDDILSIYKTFGIQNFRFAISPFAQPSDVVPWLEARGLSISAHGAKLFRTVEDPPEAACDLDIVQCGPDDASLFTRVLLEGFGMPDLLDPLMRSVVTLPDWVSYLVVDAGVPVACAAYFRQGNTAWLGCATTLESHRGRGIQGAMIARRIKDAGRAGCELLVTETGLDTPEKGNASCRNMLRSGFTLAYARPSYLLPKTD